MSIPLSTAPSRGITTVELTIPTHPGLIEALGRLAVAHTHLELALRYTVKTLSGVSFDKALDATQGEWTSEVRKRIRRLFIEKKPKQHELVKLDALLGKARRLTDQRNDYLHTAWSVSKAGEPIVKMGDHSWGPAPSNAEVERVAAEIGALGGELNYERLHGFIDEVAKRPSTLEAILAAKTL